MSIELLGDDESMAALKVNMADAAVKDNLQPEVEQGKMLPIPQAYIDDVTPSLDEALQVIKDAVAVGYRFETKEMDVFVEAMLHVLPPHEREWFHEVATSNQAPLWQALWAQWRRAQEWSMANSLILDPDWEAYGVRSMGDQECEQCHKMFTPDHAGQKFCDNRCGGKAEMAAKRAAEAVAEDVAHGDTL